MIAVEGAVAEGGGIGFRPFGLSLAHGEIVGGMFDIASADETAFFDRLLGLSDQNAIHVDRVTGIEVLGREFMFGLYDLLNGIVFSIIGDLGALLEGGKGYQYIVCRMNF